MRFEELSSWLLVVLGLGEEKKLGFVVGVVGVEEEEDGEEVAAVIA